jgi:hypothetical protein
VTSSSFQIARGVGAAGAANDSVGHEFAQTSIKSTTLVQGKIGGRPNIRRLLVSHASGPGGILHALGSDVRSSCLGGILHDGIGRTHASASSEVACDQCHSLRMSPF